MWPSVDAGGGRARHGDGGSGAVWLVTVLGVVWLTAAVVIVAGGLRALRHQAHLAADQAALAAAAAVVTGRATACRRAAVLARANGGRLVACSVRGRVADVAVTVTAGAPLPAGQVSVVVRARAGPARLADAVPEAGSR